MPKGTVDSAFPDVIYFSSLFLYDAIILPALRSGHATTTMYYSVFANSLMHDGVLGTQHLVYYHHGVILPLTIKFQPIRLCVWTSIAE